jgi:hypothetical protein
MQLIRDFWDDWLRQYEGQRKTAFARRFQSFDDHTHLSAFLELFTFAVLKRSGMSVEIEPAVGDLSLEFLATGKAGQRLFVECTATGQRAEEVNADAREGQVLEAIERVPTGRFILAVNVKRRGEQSPSTSLVTKSLEAWLEGLDAAGGEKTWEDCGWVIHFAAISGENAEDAGKGIGILGPTISDANEETARLRRAIDRKASKYGTLVEAFLIVTNSTDYHSDRSLMAVLLGDPAWNLNMRTREVTETRKPNGILQDARGPRNVAMSAVMHGYFGAWAFADKRQPLILVHHPFADKVMPRGLFPFCEERHFDPDSGDLVTTPPGMTLGEFFGLPEGWPFFDQDPDDDG